jgi:uncharacterized Zn finger protein (UPF0148 family)
VYSHPDDYDGAPDAGMPPPFELEVKDLAERLTPGDTVPEGQCPGCGAMVFEVPAPPARQPRQRRKAVPKERPEQFADAYHAIARVNHYLIGLAERPTTEELQEAYRLMVDRDLAKSTTSTRLALDLMEHDARLYHRITL